MSRRTLIIAVTVAFTAVVLAVVLTAPGPPTTAQRHQADANRRQQQLAGQFPTAPTASHTGGSVPKYGPNSLTSPPGGVPASGFAHESIQQQRVDSRPRRATKAIHQAIAALVGKYGLKPGTVYPDTSTLRGTVAQAGVPVTSLKVGQADPRAWYVCQQLQQQWLCYTGTPKRQPPVTLNGKKVHLITSHLPPTPGHNSPDPPQGVRSQGPTLSAALSFTQAIIAAANSPTQNQLGASG
jgi:hypothetical protein